MLQELIPPRRLLLGPGPSNVSYRVLKAMATPMIGHLDPAFLGIMDDICTLLRETFQTKNQMTFPVSGTGSAGMETALVNVIEPGDTAIVCINGVFGMRMADVAERCGAKVIKVEAEWGQPIDINQAIETCKAHPEAKLLGIVHAETSTGACTPLAELGAYLAGTNTLFLVDAVTSLSGVELKVDDWNIDICYSGTQKCISVPPGLAPITFNARAMDVVLNRKSKVQCWYLDVTMLAKYWGADRTYHHTAPITMMYAMREGLRIIAEEGLEARQKRHAEVAAELRAGLLEQGFTLFSNPDYLLNSLSVVFPPAAWDVEAKRKELLLSHNIEVGGGLGPVAGKVWRIGHMGENATTQTMAVFLDALKRMA